MAKQRKQDRSRQKAGSAERARGQSPEGAADAREQTGSPVDDVARKGRKPSFGHN